jgi:hypothetical protein
MTHTEDDLPRRTKLDEKGRHTQKFRNYVKQIDLRNIQDLAEDEDYFELELKQKMNYSRRS